MATTTRSQIEKQAGGELRPSYLPQSLRDKYLLSGKVDGLPSPSVHADIDWQPDRSKYEERAARRLASEMLVDLLPPGWPLSLQSPLAWSSNTFPDPNAYIHTFSASELDDISCALCHFKSLALDVQDVSKHTFPLPELGPILQRLAQDLHTGKGFFVLRGLDPSTLSGEDNTLIFLGLSAHIADRRGRQDQDGNMLVHILDASTPRNLGPSQVQSLYTNGAQPFHSDVFCDILALQTRACAAHGGRSIMASAYTVYNELASTRPDLIHTLAASDWPFDTFGRDPPYHQRPLLFLHASHLILSFSRRLLTGSAQSPRSPDIPGLSAAQAEALDAVHFAAEKHSIEVPMQPGDVRFVNNLAVLHCRDAFRDQEGVAKRHLVRLWLRNEEYKWEMPRGLVMASERVFGESGKEGERQDEEKWNLDPVVSEKMLLNRRSSCGQG